MKGVISLFISKICLDNGGHFILPEPMETGDPDNQNGVNFKITNFQIDKEVNEYEYIDNTVSYTGEGIISTTSIDKNYMVIISITLESGGDENSIEQEHLVIPVVDGIGKVVTYDYGNEGTIEKPSYKFEILGYTEFACASN